MYAVLRCSIRGVRPTGGLSSSLASSVQRTDSYVHCVPARMSIVSNYVITNIKSIIYYVVFSIDTLQNIVLS